MDWSIFFFFSILIISTTITQIIAPKPIYRWPWTGEIAQHIMTKRLPKEIVPEASFHESAFETFNKNRENFKSDLEEIKSRMEPTIAETSYESGGSPPKENRIVFTPIPPPAPKPVEKKDSNFFGKLFKYSAFDYMMAAEGKMQLNRKSDEKSIGSIRKKNEETAVSTKQVEIPIPENRENSPKILYKSLNPSGSGYF